MPECSAQYVRSVGVRPCRLAVGLATAMLLIGAAVGLAQGQRAENPQGPRSVQSKGVASVAAPNDPPTGPSFPASPSGSRPMGVAPEDALTAVSLRPGGPTTVISSISGAPGRWLEVTSMPGELCVILRDVHAGAGFCTDPTTTYQISKSVVMDDPSGRNPFMIAVSRARITSLRLTFDDGTSTVVQGTASDPLSGLQFFALPLDTPGSLAGVVGLDAGGDSVASVPEESID